MGSNPRDINNPELGTFTSDDGVHTITISNFDVNKGQVEGAYSSSSSPVGQLSISNMNGEFLFVKEPVNDTWISTYVIRFFARQRPAEKPYAIFDSWDGVYQADDTMLLTGTRAYVSGDGVMQSITLGTKVFSL